ncbi:MAG: hypothetical protein AB7I30_14270 [Isosphaeraceae bacterium]
MADRSGSWRGVGAVWLELGGHVRKGLGRLTARPVACLVTVGILLRLAGYLGDRSFWLDEISLRGNVVRRTLGDLLAPMEGTQLVPVGFLAWEVVAALLFGTGGLSLRLLPLLGGIGALIGFVPLSKRILTESAASRLVALAIFAVAGDLVYHSSELKPYSTDVAAAVACALAVPPTLSGRLSRRRVLGLTALGMVVVWFSFPSALVLGGLGLTAIGSAWRRGDRHGARVIATVCLAWLASFLLAYMMARRLLGVEGASSMRAFWNFAFPPWPPATLAEVVWPLRRIAYLFANPLDYHSRLAPGLTPWLAFPAAAIAGLGFVRMARRSPWTTASLVSPLALNLAAAHARLYPFHGRLSLFLAPALILLIGEGAGAILSASPRRWTRALVLGLLLAPPLGRYAYRFVQEGWDLSHNHVGDLRSFQLDAEWFPLRNPGRAVISSPPRP